MCVCVCPELKQVLQELLVEQQALEKVKIKRSQNVQRLHKKQDELQRTRDELDSVRDELDGTRDEVHKREAELEKKQEEVDRMQEEVDRKRRELAELHQEVESRRKEAEIYQKESNQQQTELQVSRLCRTHREDSLLRFSVMAAAACSVEMKSTACVNNRLVVMVTVATGGVLCFISRNI